jgi:hypothetical protein
MVKYASHCLVYLLLANILGLKLAYWDTMQASCKASCKPHPSWRWSPEGGMALPLSCIVAKPRPAFGALPFPLLDTRLTD